MPKAPVFLSTQSSPLAGGLKFVRHIHVLSLLAGPRLPTVSEMSQVMGVKAILLSHVIGTNNLISHII